MQIKTLKKLDVSHNQIMELPENVNLLILDKLVKPANYVKYII